MRAGRGIWPAAVALMAGALAACGGSSPGPGATVKPFLAAWDRGDWTAMAALVVNPPVDYPAGAAALTSGLGASGASHVSGLITATGATATVAISSTYDLAGIGPWQVQSTLTLVKHGGKWLVQWSPSAVDPVLRHGDRLQTSYNWAPRALILGAGGVPLTVPQPEEVVGVEGSRIKDVKAITAVLEAAGGTTLEITQALAAAKAHPTFFEPVLAITRTQYNQLGGNQSPLYQIPGTVFQTTTARGALTPGLAAHIVGSLGPVTAQELQALGPPYDSTSIVGQTGIEAAYERQLAGSPGATINVLDGSGDAVARLAAFAPKPGSPVVTSIDPTTQQAAEAALAGVPGHVALIAVDAATGQILASVSQPATLQFDQALDGVFPPGSTFKVLTASALIEAGLSPASPASCPATADIGGEVFHNAEGDAPVSNLGQAFIESCNTAFAQLASSDLKPSTFPATVAALYDIGASPRMGLLAASGSAPKPGDTADLAATAIGQASVLVSPLNMAMVAAAIDSGTSRLPRLVSGAADDSAPPRPIPGAVLAGLRQMMGMVVTSGTAAGTGLPSGTYAKTGTAQYGSGNPLPTDAWLIGYRGTMAFAMVVQDSKGNGGPVDGPVIAKFLDALPST